MVEFVEKITIMPLFYQTFLFFCRVQSNKYQKIIWLDVTSEISSSFSRLKQTQLTATLTYHYLPLLDLQPFESLDLNSLVQFLASIRHALGTQPHHDNKPVLIVCQCTMGWSRSVAMLACCLAYFGQFCPHTIRQLLDSYYPSHQVTQDYVSDQMLVNLKQKSSV